MSFRCLHNDPLEESQLGMTNFDHSIDDGLEEELAGGTLMADYAGWNFHACVYKPDKFVADVHRFHEHVDFIEARSLLELMEAVCEKWGYE